MADEIIRIIAGVLGIDVASVSEDSDIIEALGADSIDVVEIVAAIEELKEISVPDEVIPELRTVRDIEKYLELALSQKS